MYQSITPNKIRQNNRKLIYMYILNHPGVSQQIISYELRLSRPTVTTNLNELEEAGMIQRSGQIGTELVGRKAVAYSAVPDYRVSIGVNIHKHEVKIAVVNLLGTHMNLSIYEMEYENSKEYAERVCDKIHEFIELQALRKEQILGIGIAVPALVSPDGTAVTYGKILDCTGLSIEAFSQNLEYPCRFFHDSDSAAVSELWVSPELKDAIYLQVGIHLGSAMIMNHEIITGIHGNNATCEHLTLVSKGGKPCYCGKSGCAETLCSMEALTGDQPEVFFQNVRKGIKKESTRFTEYLRDLAKLINQVHLVFDKEFIIGGAIAPFLIQEDIDRLHTYVQELSPFDMGELCIRISKMPKYSITIGAALPYIIDFINQEEIL